MMELWVTLIGFTLLLTQQEHAQKLQNTPLFVDQFQNICKRPVTQTKHFHHPLSFLLSALG